MKTATRKTATKPLTPKQQEALEFIRQLTLSGGGKTTAKQVTDRLGVDHGNSSYYINPLIKAGLVGRGKDGSIYLLNPEDNGAVPQSAGQSESEPNPKRGPAPANRISHSGEDTTALLVSTLAFCYDALRGESEALRRQAVRLVEEVLETT